MAETCRRSIPSRVYTFTRRAVALFHEGLLSKWHLLESGLRCHLVKSLPLLFWLEFARKSLDLADRGNEMLQGATKNNLFFNHCLSGKHMCSVQAGSCAGRPFSFTADGHEMPAR